MKEVRLARVNPSLDEFKDEAYLAWPRGLPSRFSRGTIGRGLFTSHRACSNLPTNSLPAPCPSPPAQTSPPLPSLPSWQIDLLHLTVDTDVEVLVNQIVFEEPLISEKKKPQLRRLIYKLIEKLESKEVREKRRRNVTEEGAPNNNLVPVLFSTPTPRNSPTFLPLTPGQRLLPV